MRTSFKIILVANFLFAMYLCFSLYQDLVWQREQLRDFKRMSDSILDDFESNLSEIDSTLKRMEITIDRTNGNLESIEETISR